MLLWVLAAAVLLTLLGVNLFLTGERKIQKPIPELPGVRDPRFLRAIGSLLGPPLVPGNAAAELLNGDQIFPAMLQAIGSARQSITFETYINWWGRRPPRTGPSRRYAPPTRSHPRRFPAGRRQRAAP